ncbi:MAG: hypothetical protein R3D30_08010 [Hyphomicrobiales bacterium]
MLKTVISTAVVAALSLSAPLMATAAETSLSGEALRQAVSGKTVYLKISGFELPIHYSAGGTMKGSMSTVAAAFSRGDGASDSGKWWVAGDQLCQKWTSWMDGDTYCYKLSQNGSAVRWVRHDGRSGTARIGG